MLDDAITLLPQTKLRKLSAQYLNLAEVRSDGERKENLLTDAKAFQKTSLTGKYYQAFAVNSKNYREESNGTLAWIADCLRLLERCVAQSRNHDCSWSSMNCTRRMTTRPREQHETILCLAKTSYKKECQETFLFVGSVPTLFSSRHSAQPFERALAIGEWSCSGDVVSCFVSSHETVRFLFLPVVPFPCRDGAHSFLETDKHNDCRIANHGPI